MHGTNILWFSLGNKIVYNIKKYSSNKLIIFLLIYNFYINVNQITQVKFQIDKNQMIVKVLEIDYSYIN